LLTNPHDVMLDIYSGQSTVRVLLDLLKLPKSLLHAKFEVQPSVITLPTTAELFNLSVFHILAVKTAFRLCNSLKFNHDCLV